MVERSGLVFARTHAIGWVRRWTKWCVAAAIAVLPLAAPTVYAAGCGGVCLPLEALDPQNTHVNLNQLRVSVVAQYANLNHYHAGTDAIPNPGGASASIAQVTAIADYGITRRITASMLVPYVWKRQTTNKFGERIADGVGDVALFGRYALIVPHTVSEPMFSVGLGAKFPTGSTNQPDGGPLLPPALQVGSGAYDLVPTASYFQRLNRVELFGSALLTVPLDANDIGYRFGREFQLHAGAVIPLRWWGGRVAVLDSFDYTFAQHDHTVSGVLPAKLVDGTRVINTGGRFLDMTPGLRVYLWGGLSLQARFSVPIYQYWNGDAAKGIGQVAQGLTTQVSLIYTQGKRW